jgi:hypothetical protein
LGIGDIDMVFLHHTLEVFVLQPYQVVDPQLPILLSFKSYSSKPLASGC